MRIATELFGCGLWDVVVGEGDIHVGRTVIRESAFFETDDGQREQIDLGPYVKDGRIKTFDVDSADTDAFIDRFDVSHVEKLDPGETEALAKLESMSRDTKICSAGKIVFKALVCLDKDDQGISLEEVLSSIGRGEEVELALHEEIQGKLLQRRTPRRHSEKAEVVQAADENGNDTSDPGEPIWIYNGDEAKQKGFVFDVMKFSFREPERWFEIHMRG